METTRHFTATVYVVHDGAVALHHHDRLDMWLPPGGHVGRDERPRETARREVREETGLDVDILEPETGLAVEAGRELPPPEHVMLFDIDVYPDGEVGHQHVDFVYFGEAENRDISPADGEASADEWEWFGREDLRRFDGLTSEVVELGAEAIERVQAR
ncbi:NUDIX domain-containing protein [Halorussus salilacus]|uniref:NUDIX hydrolase n=1 Tax=Halorussus salilacus TaxID=2953750 RepID=UPI0020A159B6|nr:NUDIX domain-containing protein [Halorussus salilacus]USZ68456.1 NUDIX domain-containing protein [Halorussus salilacus]